jgi:hypothetical protein
MDHAYGGVFMVGSISGVKIAQARLSIEILFSGSEERRAQCHKRGRYDTDKP